MRRRATLAVCVALALLAAPAAALAQASAPDSAPPSPPPATTPPPPPPPPEPEQAEAQPPAPAPPAVQAPAAQPPAAQASAGGQWVYTQQYGWVWMQYGDSFTYVPPSGTGEPLAYVYYPAVGWTWLVAPWVWGVGPWPYFGARGPGYFAWYHHGWWRTPARWHFRTAPVPVVRAPTVRTVVTAPHGVRAAPTPAARRSAHEIGHAPHEVGHHERRG